jgi:hypothetical protein
LDLEDANSFSIKLAMKDGDRVTETRMEANNFMPSIWTVEEL